VLCVILYNAIVYTDFGLCRNRRFIKWITFTFIRNVFNFCKAEKVRGTFISFDQSSVRAAAMTGVSRASLYRVVSEIELVDLLDISCLCKYFLFYMILLIKIYITQIE